MCQKLIENVEVMWVFDFRLVIVVLHWDKRGCFVEHIKMCNEWTNEKAGQLWVMNEKNVLFALENLLVEQLSFDCVGAYFICECKWVECSSSSLRHLEKALVMENRTANLLRVCLFCSRLARLRGNCNYSERSIHRQTIRTERHWQSSRLLVGCEAPFKRM